MVILASYLWRERHVFGASRSEATPNPECGRQSSQQMGKCLPNNRTAVPCKRGHAQREFPIESMIRYIAPLRHVLGDGRLRRSRQPCTGAALVLPLGQ